MRYNIKLSLILVLSVFLIACCKKRASEILPEYRMIKRFFEKIKPTTNLSFYSYGVNNNLPKGHEFKNDVVNFSLGYFLYKTQNDEVSLENARALLLSVAESFLEEINSNSEIRSLLRVYPFDVNSITIDIQFKDENGIDLGKGISMAYLSKGKIKYERYEIREYRTKYPSIGEHFTVHKESYAEALDIVKSEGSMIDLGCPLAIRLEK